MRKREAIEPRNLERAEADVFHATAGSNAQTIGKMNNKKFGDKTYIGWNFTKFLVDREGRVVARFEPTVDMKEVRSAVEAIL